MSSIARLLVVSGIVAVLASPGACGESGIQGGATSDLADAGDAADTADAGTDGAEAEVSGDPCSEQACDPASGACAPAALPKGTPCAVDDDPCTVEVCDGEGACVLSGFDTSTALCADRCLTDANCDDGDACTVDTCTEATTCARVPVVCDDGDPCTVDLCDPEEGCGTEAPAEDCDNGVDDDCDGQTDCADEACATEARCITACDAEAIVAIGCGDVAEPGDLAVGNIAGYACPTAAAMPGPEAIYSFTAESDGAIRVEVQAEPQEYVSLLLLAGECDGGACVAAQQLGGAENVLIAQVEAGQTYYLAVDSAVGGVLTLSSLWLQCSAGEVCDNGTDDDWDGLTDCQDPGCAGAGPPCEEEEASCDDALDNDADALTDCADPDCAGAGFCELIEASCADELDNDGDGLTDCADPSCAPADECLNDCAAKAIPLECGATFASLSGQGHAFYTHHCAPGSWPHPEVIFRFQPQTSGLARLDLMVTTPGAVVIAARDGCGDDGACVGKWSPEPYHVVQAAQFAFEAGETYYVMADAAPVAGGDADSLSISDVAFHCSAAEVCDNGGDDDWDDKVDCADPDCLAAGAPCELAEATCDDDFDNDGDGQIDCADVSCVITEPGCESPETSCHDGMDNDGNGKTDCADPACLVAGCEPSEVSCGDQDDNDGDGLADCADPDCAAATGCVATCDAPTMAIDCGWQLDAPLQSAATSLPASACLDASTPGAELVFSFMPDKDYKISFEVSGPGVGDTMTLAMHAGECATDTCVAWPTPLDAAGNVRVGVTAGETYYFIVDRTVAGMTSVDSASLACFSAP